MIVTPSISLLVLIVDVLARWLARRPLLHDDERTVLLTALAIIAVITYPSALGIVSVDVYHFGFTAIAPWVIAAAGVVAAISGEMRLAAITAVILVALDLELLPSVNAIDYVVDPVAAALALFSLPFVWLRRAKLDVSSRSV